MYLHFAVRTVNRPSTTDESGPPRHFRGLRCGPRKTMLRFVVDLAGSEVLSRRPLDGVGLRSFLPGSRE